MFPFLFFLTIRHFMFAFLFLKAREYASNTDILEYFKKKNSKNYAQKTYKHQSMNIC